MKLTKQHLRRMIREELKRSKRLVKENGMSKLPQWQDALETLYAAMNYVDGDMGPAPWENRGGELVPGDDFADLVSALKAAGQDPRKLVAFARISQTGDYPSFADESVGYDQLAHRELSRMYEALGEDQPEYDDDFRP